MVLDRKIIQELIEKHGLKEEQIRSELEPLQSNPHEFTKKLLSLIGNERMKKFNQDRTDSFREDLKEIDNYNKAIKEKLEQQEAIFKQYTDKIENDIGNLNNKYSSLFGEETSKKIMDALKQNSEESERILSESLTKTIEDSESKIQGMRTKINGLNEQLEESRRTGRFDEEAIQARKQISDEITKETKLLNEENEKLTKIKNDTNTILENHKKYREEIAKTNKGLTEQNEKLQQARSLYNTIVQENQELSKLSETTGDHIGSMLESMNPNASGYSRTIFSSIAAEVMMLNNTHEKFGDKMSAFSSFFKDKLLGTFGDVKKAITGLFDYVYEQSIGKAIKLNVEYAELNKSTGGMGKKAQAAVMGENLLGNLATDSNLARFAIGTKELNKTFGELSNSMRGFNNLTVSAQRELTVATSMMENLGMAGSQAGKMFETFISAFNKTTTGAKETMERMAKDAVALNVSISQYFQQFEAVLSKISGYGTSVEKIFKDLNAIANVSKLSVEQVASFGDKIKTLEGASEIVAGLGAALGGTSLQATELVALNPAEAFIRIKEELDASGVAFDKLNVGMQRFLAEKTGFSSVNDAAKAFNASLSDIRAEMDKAGASQEELRKKQEDSAAFQEQYKKILENLTILVTPLMKLINGLSSVMLALTEIPVVGFLLPLIGMMGMLAFAIRKTFGIGARFFGMIRGSAAAFTQMNASIASGDAAYATLAGTLAVVAANAQTAAIALGEAATAAAAAQVATGGMGMGIGALPGIMAGGQATGALANLAGSGTTLAAAEATTLAGAETAAISSGLATGGAATGGGLLSGIGAFLTNPITLAVLATAALTYGGYKLIERSRKPLIPKAAGVLPGSIIPAGKDVPPVDDINNYTTMLVDPQDQGYLKDGKPYVAKVDGPMDQMTRSAEVATQETKKATGNMAKVASLAQEKNDNLSAAIENLNRAGLEKDEQIINLLKQLNNKDSQTKVDNNIQVYANIDKDGLVSTVVKNLNSGAA